jgi:AbrB family looped-hinge helix DNA binding protein
MVFGIMNGMNVRIDGAGRIVLPKHLRERFRLTAGSEIAIEERPEGLVLRRVEQGPSMVLRNGFWVHLGKLSKTVRWETLVDEEREERIRDLSGL